MSNILSEAIDRLLGRQDLRTIFYATTGDQIKAHAHFVNLRFVTRLSDIKSGECFIESDNKRYILCLKLESGTSRVMGAYKHLMTARFYAGRRR